MRRLGELVGLLLKPFGKENILFFCLMYLLGLTGTVFEHLDGSRFWMTFELFFDLYVYSLLIFLLPLKVRRIVRCVSAFFFYLLSLIDMACYVRLNMPITPILLQLTLQSNAREAAEALASYLDWKMLCSPLSLEFVQFLLWIYVVSHKRKIDGYVSGLSAAISKKIKLSAKVCVLLLVVVGGLTSLDNKQYMYYRIVRQYSELETQKIKDFSPKTKYYLPVYRLAYSLSETHRLQGEIKQFERSMDKAQIDSVDYLSPHIVVIIGESYNRHHSALYGYGKNTTPRQNRRLAEGEMVLFMDMISSWNTTCESFKNMFSTQFVGQEGSWASAPPYPLLFRKAGYHTTFISNQYVEESVGFSAFIEDAFFNNPQTSGRMFDCRNKKTHRYDLSLLDEYAALGDKKYPHTLDIFHFLGLHIDFRMRYPSSFARFTADDYDRKDLPADSRQIIADYDNAILYNDFVIDSILKLYEKEDAVVIFVPDHGERVFDDSTEWGRNLTWEKNDIVQQFDIPFWIWGSSRYRAGHQELWLEIKKAANKRGMTDTLAQMLLHIAGIHTKWFYPQADMLSDKYNDGRKRIIRGEKDYDKIVGN